MEDNAEAIMKGQRRVEETEWGGGDYRWLQNWLPILPSHAGDHQSGKMDTPIIQPSENQC